MTELNCSLCSPQIALDPQWCRCRSQAEKRVHSLLHLSARDLSLRRLSAMRKQKDK